MKVLIAAISSRQPPWGAMIDTSKETWDSVDVPGVETIYYVGSPASPLQKQVLGVPVNESYHSMGRKNLLAWEWMLENREWDFMARVNASCFVHKPRLLDLCATLPTSGLVQGSIVGGTDPPWMWGGYQFILSRDVVQALVDKSHVWPHNEMEDVALSHATRLLGYEFMQSREACSIDRTGENEWLTISNNGNSFSFTDWADVRKLDTQVFFRVKQDQRRHEDADIMKRLYDQYFGSQA